VAIFPKTSTFCTQKVSSKDTSSWWRVFVSSSQQGGFSGIARRTGLPLVCKTDGQHCKSE